MEDGDLWQAYGNPAAANTKQVAAAAAIMTANDDDTTDSSPPEECQEKDDDASSTASATATATNNDLYAGPPVNIYAEAHRHAKLAAGVAFDSIHGSKVREEEGPHASLHLSSELKQKRQTRLHGDETVIKSEQREEAIINDVTSSLSAVSDGAPETIQTTTEPNNNEEVETNDVVGDTVSDSSTYESGNEGADLATETTAKDQDDAAADVGGDTTASDETPAKPIKPTNTTQMPSEDEEDDEGPREKVLVDYASKLAGAQILEKSSTLKGASNLLTGDTDRYAIAPCGDKKYVVVGLSEDILVKQIKLSNFERYSSHVREFQVLASQEYPAPSAEYWNLIGTFEANSRNGEQTFDLEEPAWARYLKFKFKSHYGDEHYCTLSQIKVHGSTMLQGFHEQWIESEKKELEQEKMMEQENQQQQHEQQHEEGKNDYTTVDQQQHGEDDDVAVKEIVEESKVVPETKGDGSGASDPSQQKQPEPIVGSKQEGNVEMEENVVGAPSEEESSDEELPSSIDQVIDSSLPSSDDTKKELSGKDEGTAVSMDNEASIPREETESDPPVLNQQNATVVVAIETAGDDNELNEEKQEQRLDETDNSNINPNQPIQTDSADDVSQANADDKAARDDTVTVAVVEEETATEMPNAPDTVKTDTETIPDGADVANDNDGEDVVESSTSSSLAMNQVEKSAIKTPKTTNKKHDIDVSNLDPISVDVKADDDATVPSQLGAIEKESKGDTDSNAKDPPGKPIEKEVVVTTSSPPSEKNEVKTAAKQEDVATSTSITTEKKDVRATVRTSGELISKIAKRFPHASCIKDLDFHAFKSKTLLSNAVGQLGGQMPGPKMEPIFTKITNEIKSVQITQHQYEQYISAVKNCYEKLFLDMVNDLDSIQNDYDRRLSNIEEVLGSAVPGGLSKSSDNRLMAIFPTFVPLVRSEYAHLVISVSFTLLMIFLRIRQKKTNLKKPSVPTLKRTNDVKASTPPLKQVATPLATPSSSGDVSPSSINIFEEHERKELHSTRTDAVGEPSLIPDVPLIDQGASDKHQPTIMRIISGEEKENNIPSVIPQTNEQLVNDTELSHIISSEEMSNDYSSSSIEPPNCQIAKELKVSC